MSIEGRLRTAINPNRPRISTVQSRKNARGQKMLPALDNVVYPSLISTWKSFYDSISIFLTHNSETVSFRNSLSKKIVESDETFSEFNQNISRNCSNRKQSTSSSVSTPSKALISTALPFLRSFGELKNLILQISQNGTKSIQETVESSFAKILETYDTIKHSSDDLPSNDPIMKRIQTLTLILNPIKKSVISILRRQESSDGQGRLTTELRNYSRTINSAFRSEFSVLPLNAADMENLRTTAYNACSDIIYGMKSITMFEENISRVKKFMLEFERALERECRANGLSSYIGKSEEEPKKEMQKTVFSSASSSASMPNEVETFNINEFPKLSSLLTRLMSYVKEGGNNPSFLQDVVEQSIKMSEEIEKEMDGYDPNHVTHLEKQLFEIRETLNNKTDDTVFLELKSCMFESIETMRKKLNQPNVPLKGEEEIASTFSRLFEEFSSKFVEEDKTLESELQNLLNVKDKSLIIENIKEKLSLIDFYKNESEKYNNDLTKKIHERICIISQQMNIDLGENDVYTLDKISDYFSDYQEKVNKSEKASCHMISAVFGLDEPDNMNMNNTIFRVKQWKEKQEKLHRSYQDILSEAESRLQKHLSVSPSNKPITESMNSLLDLLDKSSNQQSYKKLSAIYNRIQSLNTDPGEASTLNAGSDYFTQINSMIDVVAEQMCKLQKSHKVLLSNVQECKNLVKALHTKLMRYCGVSEMEQDTSEFTFQDLIKETAELVDEMKEREESYVSDNFIRDAFGALSKDDPRSVILDRASRLQIIDFSLQSLQPFSAILEQALGNADTSSETWFSSMRSYTVALNAALNNVASSKINSTIFLLISRFISLISTLIPTISSHNSRVFN